MENHIKGLETNLAEQIAYVRILQSNQSANAVSAAILESQQLHQQQAQLVTSLALNPAASAAAALHARQLSGLTGTPTSAAAPGLGHLSLHAKQLSTPIPIMGGSLRTPLGQRSPGLAVTQADLLRSALGTPTPASAAQELLRTQATVDVLQKSGATNRAHAQLQRELLRSATPTAELMRSVTPVAAQIGAGGRRDSAPGEILASALRNRNASGST